MKRRGQAGTKLFLTIYAVWYKMVNMKIKRRVFNELRSQLGKPDVLILLGARQVGKTTLMEELSSVASDHFERVRSFNLEFPDDLLFFSRPERELFNDLAGTPNSIIFIDEFHYGRNISKLFKAIYDSKKGIKIVASGSSSLEIHKHLRESLAGRRHVVRVYPLTWEEWKQTGGTIEEFITFGGMPGLVHLSEEQEKIAYLSQLVEAYLLKDIKGLIREENITAFNHLLYYLAENQGQVIPVSNLAREIRLTNRTTEHYLDILAHTYVVYGLHSFSRRLSNELKKSRKYYFFDNGIRNAIIKNFSSPKTRSNAGFLYEAHTFLELHKRLRPNMELKFWRTKQGDEVDFIFSENQVPIPVEVKSAWSGWHVPKGLYKFLKNYPEAPYGILANPKTNERREIQGKIIEARKFSELLL